MPAQGILDEATLLVVDENDTGIYACDDSVQFVDFIPLDKDQSRNPSSVDFDDTFLYVLDRVAKRIYRYDGAIVKSGVWLV